MPNKPNFKTRQIITTTYSITTYDSRPTTHEKKNEPNYRYAGTPGNTAIPNGFDILSGKWYNTQCSGNIYTKQNRDLK